MKVYIASKYLDNIIINKKIHDALTKAKIDSFLPISINVDAITKEEMYFVAEKCYDEIDICDVVLVVSPYGKSVASEIGYAIAEIRRHQNKQLVLFCAGNDEKPTELEAMIEPYIDKKVKSIPELIEYLHY